MKHDKVKVAVAQMGSVGFDRDATIDEVCRVIDTSAAAGAQLVLFPEALVPAYPRGIDFGVAVGHRQPEGRLLWQAYWDQAVAIPSPALEKVAVAARKAGVYVALGIIERVERYLGGTLYCTLVYFDPNGELMGYHRKLKPTGSERLIWGQGDGSTLNVFQTHFGRMGGLICWENYMPLARTALYHQGIEIYLAPTADARESWQASMRHIACEGRCFVLSCNQFVTRENYPEPWLAALGESPPILCRGGSVIISPMGDVLAGPLWDREGVIYAELDMADLAQARFDFDSVGHYARPDLFRLQVNRQPAPLVEDGDDPTPTNKSATIPIDEDA